MKYKIDLIFIYLVLILTSIAFSKDNHISDETYEYIESYETESNITSSEESISYLQETSNENEDYKDNDADENDKDKNEGEITEEINLETNVKTENNSISLNLKSNFDKDNLNMFKINFTNDSVKKYEQKLEYYYLEDDGQTIHYYESNESKEENMNKPTDKIITTILIETNKKPYNNYQLNEGSLDEEKDFDKYNSGSYEDY
ncbi:Hypothetical protein SRAE_2000515600 [Strongyloides ratti]|uniref:Uncharacterized protein n=1 Tax=Strongyloides ratti TaxID=34506 RepID=A0A090LLD1_STRRB|nr:Hypothetical protein SRAE_2000515600 [Strongyloides ratti]CEF70525.1 Hypothetical protein SRAE_2000515600 [Strongyloides ratti]